MEFYHIFGFLSILKESLQLIPRNRKLLALTCFLQILFSSILLSILNFELKFLFHDIILKTSILSTSIDDTFKIMEIIAAIKEDFRNFLIVYVAILVSLSLISFLYTIATIILSSNINISLKEFVLKISKAFKYAFITRLYTNMLSIGYFFIVLFLLCPISISSSNIFLFSIGIFVGIISFIFFLYLSIVWILALVISVIEEDCYGIKAIEKAGRLIKGNRLKGFMLNILFSIISSLLYLCYLKINKPNKGVINQILMSIFLVIISSLFNLLLLVAYTVLYSHCKKNHGEEEVELDGSFEYSKV
ncbi:hypothetical protein MTR67_029843 [Solanum verrucosum]|uniref:Uncharacterized protein n=1 Tax=Solanum verrucosum TaxID=315347 RepID=A0AAF0U0Y3_SOLVR|nr:uncharacterized protein LOC125824525 [Solanum verrucosum]WMV36458.1 hypothetical protein MTR67_029843 [Solanum verrucosum]